MRHAPYSNFTDAKPQIVFRGIGPAIRLSSVVAKLLWLLTLPRRVAAIRRDMTLLGRMSGSELADIGLSRQDVWDATALPLGQSPEPLFARRAAERQRAARSRRH